MCDSLCVFDLLCVHVNCARNDPGEVVPSDGTNASWIGLDRVESSEPDRLDIQSIQDALHLFNVNYEASQHLFVSIAVGVLTPRTSMYHPQTVDGRRLLRVVGALGDNPNTVGCRVGSEKLECAGRMFTAGISPQSQYRALC